MSERAALAVSLPVDLAFIFIVLAVVIWFVTRDDYYDNR